MSFTQNHPAAEAAIRAKVEQWLAATQAKNLPAILAYYAEDVLAFDAIGQLQFRGREAYGQHWARCLEFCPGGINMQLHELHITADDKLGFAHALVHCAGVDEQGQEQGGWMRMSACFAQRGGEWQAVHEHFSAPFDPENNQVLQGLQP